MKRKACWALGLTALFFLPPILYLILHRLGWVARHPAVAYERATILVLLLDWAIAAALLLAWWVRESWLGWARRQAPALVLAGVTSLLCLGFCEVALRFLRPEIAEESYERWPSPTLHHRNAPSRASAGMGGHEIRTNRDGFRSPYEREDFLQYDQRIVLLGDSYVFGLGVGEDETVGRQLEQQLEQVLKPQGQPSLAVLNTGVISYSPFLERQVFEQLAKPYQPTLTLLFVDVNDIGDDYQYAQENTSGDPARPRFDVPDGPRPKSWCQRSAVCKALGPLWEKWALPWTIVRKALGRHRPDYDYYRFSVEIDGKVEKDRFFILRHPLEKTRPFFAATLANIQAVATAARAAGSDFALVVMPRYFHWNDAECPRNWESFRYRVDEPFENEYLRFFEETRSTVDFPILSLLEDFRASRSGPLVFEQDPHWNAAGHQLAATSITRQLRELGWPREKGRTNAENGP